MREISESAGAVTAGPPPVEAPRAPMWPGGEPISMPADPETSLVIPEAFKQEVVEASAAAATESATAAVGDLTKTVVTAGRQHLADAKAAADTIATTAQAATASIRTQAENAREVLAATQAKIREEHDVVDGGLRKLAADVISATGEATEATKAATEATQTVTKAAEALRDDADEAVLTAVTKVLQRIAQSPDGLKLVETAAHKLGPKHHNTPLLEALIQASVPVYLHGQAGSGKSTAGKLTAEKFGIDFRSVSLSAATTEAKLLGFTDANGITRRTALRHVLEAGGIFLFDEVDAASANAMTVMNATLANGETEFPDERIKHNPNARFVAAANTIGAGATAQYVGRNRLDAATLDRFGYIQWDIDPRLEDFMAWGDSDLPERQIDLQAGGVPTVKEWKKIVELYRDETAPDKHLVTPRATMYGRSLIELDLGEGKTGLGLDHLRAILIHKGAKPEQTKKWDGNVGRKLASGFRPGGTPYSW